MADGATLLESVCWGVDAWLKQSRGKGTIMGIDGGFYIY
jgi:hypothetical protein